MSVRPLLRPIVRSFKRKFEKEAARHVRAGGHAVVWDSEARAELFFQTPPKGHADDFGAWAVYDMGKSRWKTHRDGVFAGLSSTLVPKDCLWIAKRRTERDSMHPGSQREVSFDCTSCAACCRDNEVILQPSDIERFAEGGRPELAKLPYAKRRKDGALVLTLLPNKRCRHLKRNNHCGIYELRPHPCSEFPMGSECCIFAREDVLGLYDGVRPES